MTPLHSHLPTEPQISASQAAYEDELIAVFTGFSETFGAPPSLGAIYGLLFASSANLTMEEITVRLQISKGSASQGLRHLEEIGAVIRERSNGERSHRYCASQKLKDLTAGFLRERLLPSIESGRRRIERIEALMPQLEPGLRNEAQKKLAKLSRWHRRATSLLPIVQRFLQTD